MVALHQMAVHDLGKVAMTIHAFCHSHVFNSTLKGRVLLDNVSQAYLALAICFVHLHNTGTHIVCFGGTSQRQPVELAWRGTL